MKEKIRGLDFVRAFCIIGIATYHASIIFINESNITNSFFGRLASSGWGNIFVTVFFVVSGFCLVYNNEYPINIKGYYKKRFLSIFISFYLVWLVMFFKNVFVHKSLFYAGRPASILLSFIGMDGYWGGSYYFIGEWFLGALIICYLLYPVLLYGFHKNKWVTSVIVTVLYFIGLKHKIGFWDISFRGVFTCLMSFWIGIMLGQEKVNKEIQKSPLVFVVAADVFWHLYTCKVTGLDSTTWSVLMGVTFFIAMCVVGDKITKSDLLYKVIKFLSAISYQIFLLHHLIIYKFNSVVKGMNIEMTRVKTVVLYLMLMIIIIACSWILKKVNDVIVKKLKRSR